MSRYSFIPPDSAYALPRTFNYRAYIDTERELWALFPETEGKRVNFCQMGLTARIFIESDAEGDLGTDETYFLMPCSDGKLRPLRMKAERRLTLSEFRMSHMTALKLAEAFHGTGKVMDAIHLEIMGPEILEGI